MRIEMHGHSSDPAIAWARLGDSDFLNRVAGNGRIEMRFEPREAGPSRIVGESAGPFGTRMAFEEGTRGWVWRRWFRQARQYQSGAVTESRFELRLEPDGGGLVPHISLELDPASLFVRPLIHARAAQMRARWQAQLDALPGPGEAAAPAVHRTLGPDARSALARWRELASAPVVDAVGRMFEEARETELQGLRPFEIADRFGLDREETLVGMLRGVRAGAVELFWSVRCQRCQVEVSASVSLSDIADHATCQGCRIGFEADLATSVEVRFAPHPAVVPRLDQRFCTLFPAAAPATRAAILLEPGEAIEEEVELERGRWLLGSSGPLGDGEVVVGDTGADEVRWSSGRAAVQRVRTGAVALRAHNDSEQLQQILLVCADPDEAIVPASLVATLPEFRRELDTQLLAPNVRIGTRIVALLFTDLSGSTAMYEHLGDARAYALVRDHFVLLAEVVEQHGGTVVKTIGDAVMASFHSAFDAVRAALAMQAAFDGWVADQAVRPAPRLNVGVHCGPALAVHTDASGLDWFGRTVNLAARTQSVAQGGALVMTEGVRTEPRVAALLHAQGLAPEGFEADLKGLGRVRLHRLEARALAEEGLRPAG